MQFDKQEQIDADDKKVKNLTKDYHEIYEGLKILENQKMADSTYLYNLVVLTERLVKVVADRQSTIKREVNTMGGRVLELESDKIIQRSREEGENKAIILIQKLIDNKRVEDISKVQGSKSYRQKLYKEYHID